ncbi:MAG: hypothetical protein K0U34_08470 [Alphaproteobacteria bacterium]|nr:hypothetical protein [Alphaproteobacteria bacterium]
MWQTVGLDVGGAHLKVALANGGQISSVEQFACPLWRGLKHLHTALAATQPLLASADRIAITMTGELSDLFPDRKTGVATLVDVLSEKLGNTLQFWLGQKGFGDAAAARAHPADTGSTNFLASAEFAASKIADGVLIDFGSTTADIILLQDGKPAPIGISDAERLTSGELVYTGLTRTAVMGVTTRAPFQGQWQGLAREYLATMADVRRVLSELPDGTDLHQTADGRSKSLEDSVDRLARMFGRDGDDGSLEDWRQAAAFIREAQIRSLQNELLRILTRANLAITAPIIAAGIGCDSVRVLARRIGRPVKEFGTLANADQSCQRAATHAAPAVALAHLVEAGPAL